MAEAGGIIEQANGAQLKPKPTTLRDLAQRLCPNPALTVDGTLQIILDGIERIEDEHLGRALARANMAKQIGGDPGPLSDELWNGGDLGAKLRLIQAATKRVMLEQQQNRKNTAAQIKAQRQIVEALLKRLHFKAKRKKLPDVIGGGLRQRIAGCDEMLAKIAKETADYAEAIKYLDHYGFDFDRPAEQTVGATLWIRTSL